MAEPQILTLICPEQLEINGIIQLPGSKSETNRALLIGAVTAQRTGHPFVIENVSDSDDSRVFINFLTAVGFGVELKQDQTLVTITPLQTLPQAPVNLYLGHAGTALRFITAFSCFLPVTVNLTGSTRLSERPIAPLVTCLQNAGANIDYLEKEGFLPLTIYGNPNWQPTQFTIDAAQSSQLLSALMLCAGFLGVNTPIYTNHQRLTSLSYIEMTRQMLLESGYGWVYTPDGYLLQTTNPLTDRLVVESDWSAASYWIGMLALKPGDILLKGLKNNSLQGDSKQLSIVKPWGVEPTFEPAGLRLCNHNPSPKPLPTDIDFSDMPDLAQTYAVVLAYADGASSLRGLHTLPLKETNRIVAVCQELVKLNINTASGSDYITIFPRQNSSFSASTVLIDTYHDHRMAMAFSLAVFMQGQIRIKDPAVVSKSYPNFWRDLESVGFVLRFD